MPTILAIHYFILLIFSGLLVWAVISDFSSMTIPNRLPIAVSILFVAHIFASPTPVDWIGSLEVAAAVFVFSAVLFHFRLMGGGDVKLMAAIALWAGPQNVLGFLLITSLTGGALARIALSKFAPYVEFALHFVGGTGTAGGMARRVIPYGIAIAVGGFSVVGVLLKG
jgi:prepilin peptidase CpaA